MYLVVCANQNIDSIGEVADKTLKDLGLATCAVVSVGTKEPALRAFELMAEHNFSAIPLVDASGKLFTNISNSDVRYMVTIDKLEVRWPHPSRCRAILSHSATNNAPRAPTT